MTTKQRQADLAQGPHEATDPQERGSALIWALMFVVLSSGLIVAHSAFVAANRGARNARVQSELQSTLAVSGLRDALGWFHRQPIQPVTNFDLTQDPDVPLGNRSTLDPTIGIVREYPISGNLYGRYEVPRDRIVDISPERGLDSMGLAWDVAATGYLYRLRDPSKAFDEAPNQIVGRSTKQTEIRWLEISPPISSALFVGRNKRAPARPQHRD